MKHSRYFQSPHIFIHFLFWWKYSRPRKLVGAQVQVPAAGMWMHPSGCLWSGPHHCCYSRGHHNKLVDRDAWALTIKNQRHAFSSQQDGVIVLHVFLPDRFQAAHETFGYILPSAGRIFVLKWYVLSRAVVSTKPKLLAKLNKSNTFLTFNPIAPAQDCRFLWLLVRDCCKAQSTKSLSSHWRRKGSSSRLGSPLLHSGDNNRTVKATRHQ